MVNEIQLPRMPLKEKHISVTKSFSAFNLRSKLFLSKVLCKCSRPHKTYKSIPQSLPERNIFHWALPCGRMSSSTKKCKSWAQNSLCSSSRTYRLVSEELVLLLTTHADKILLLEVTRESPTWTAKTRTITVALEFLLKRTTRLNDTTVRARPIFAQCVPHFL